MALAENVKARRSALRMSQQDLAAKAGVSQQLINAVENGRVRNTKFLPEISNALNCDVKDLDSRFESTQFDHFGSQGRPAVSRELPVWGLSINEHAIAALSPEPIDFLDLQGPLRQVKTAYGALVPDDSMSPELEPGNIILVNPHLPPIPNVTCLLMAVMGGNKFATIRRVSQISNTEWSVELFNPTGNTPRSSQLDRSIWTECHRIVGRYW